jgi:hypothetical protein
MRWVSLAVPLRVCISVPVVVGIGAFIIASLCKRPPRRR